MVFIPRKIGESIKASVEIINAVLPPLSRIVNNPIIKTVAEETSAGTILITNIESPNRNFHTVSTAIDNGG